MYAIEFQSKINNGIIQIPIEYQEQIKEVKNAKVIVLTEQVQKVNKSNKFNAMSIKTKGYKFDREAANAR
ncbi:MAG: hypothetical protein FWF46_05850 [Oscillospiraceae bacterium]|nr:hypothetical protein [Oscillospiraceae bacterium]